MAQKPATIAGIIDDIRRVFQVVHEQSRKAEKATGLTSPQLWALKTIAQESPIMVSDIARRMYLHPATVVGILDRLEKQNLVIRVRSIDDRRIVRVELTAKGRTLRKKAPEIAQNLLVGGLEKLPQRNLNKIASSMKQIVGMLGAQDKPVHLILSPEVNWPQNKIKKR
jgi:DNA-binding MarR family transcriptional regulator